MLKLAPVNDTSGVLYLVDPMWIFSSRIWKDVSSRVATHAPTKYQGNSTSGRGARASYRTMLPEISARRSLLEPSFRYLSPGREGEKCRPLDHTWQNPFVHSARLTIGNNSYIYHGILVISSMWYVQVCQVSFKLVKWYIINDCACAPAETLLFMPHSLVFFHMVCAGAYWHKIHDIHACAFAVQTTVPSIDSCPF